MTSILTPPPWCAQPHGHTTKNVYTPVREADVKMESLAGIARARGALDLYGPRLGVEGTLVIDQPDVGGRHRMHLLPFFLESASRHRRTAAKLVGRERHLILNPSGSVWVVSPCRRRSSAVRFSMCTLRVVVAAAALCVAAAASIMNAGGVSYAISNPGAGGPYVPDFGNREFFEVYSPVTTRYSQVYWTRNAPVPLPAGASVATP